MQTKKVSSSIQKPIDDISFRKKGIVRRLKDDFVDFKSLKH